eukprot:XP_001692282.1 predicted protein [Chlamydomonas reinhardtii]
MQGLDKDMHMESILNTTPAFKEILMGAGIQLAGSNVPAFQQHLQKTIQALEKEQREQQELATCSALSERTSAALRGMALAQKVTELLRFEQLLPDLVRAAGGSFPAFLEAMRHPRPEVKQMLEGAALLEQIKARHRPLTAGGGESRYGEEPALKRQRPYGLAPGRALGWLPPVQVLTEAPEPGAWCFTAPLWGNPLLTPSPAAASGEQEEEDSGSDGETAVEPVPAGVARRTQGRGLDYRHRTLRACARLVTIGDLVRAHAARPPAAAAVDWEGWLRDYLAPSDGRRRRRGPTLAALQGLVGDIPPSWWSAAQAHAAQLANPGPAPVPAPSTSEVVRTTIMPRMGWKLSGSETLKVPLAKLSVRMATSMQLDDVATRRADLHEDYERAAQGLPPRAVVRREDLPAAAAATLGAIRDTLARLWQKPGVNPVELACARAVADFWSRLMQFAQLGVPQKGWDGVDATHPILAVVNGEMLCAMPQAMELEA